MKKIILLSLLLTGCAVYNTPGFHAPQYPHYTHGYYPYSPYLRHPDPHNYHFHNW